MGSTQLANLQSQLLGSDQSVGPEGSDDDEPTLLDTTALVNGQDVDLVGSTDGSTERNASARDFVLAHARINVISDCPKTPPSLSQEEAWQFSRLLTPSQKRGGSSTAVYTQCHSSPS